MRPAPTSSPRPSSSACSSASVAPVPARDAPTPDPPPRRDLPRGAEANAALAARLRDYADLLEAQGEGGFRVAAYLRAADTVAGLDRPAAAILAAQGRAGLMALPGIGASIAAALAEMLATGRWSQLERLRGTLDPEALFRTIPGIGPGLAARLHDALDAETLEALEIAAHDGRLEKVPGVGPRRAELIRLVLAERLGRPRLRRMQRRQPRPPVALLLDVDREYRARAARGELKRIAPRRFNPTGDAWLPILHTRRGDWDLTALHSNTGLAHQLGRTGDWVVIYYHAEATPEGRCTVVTERRPGPLAGRRVVRGREAECERHYAAT